MEQLPQKSNGAKLTIQVLPLVTTSQVHYADEAVTAGHGTILVWQLEPLIQLTKVAQFLKTLHDFQQHSRHLAYPKVECHEAVNAIVAGS